MGLDEHEPEPHEYDGRPGATGICGRRWWRPPPHAVPGQRFVSSLTDLLLFAGVVLALWVCQNFPKKQAEQVRIANILMLNFIAS